MFVLSLLSYKLRTKTAKLHLSAINKLFILYIQLLGICGILLQTVEFIHNSDFWATKVEKSA